MRRALAARRAAGEAEANGIDECVDRYYESSVLAHTALVAVDDPCGRDARCARDLYNDSLTDCLRTAGRFGRIDPRSQLLVNGPCGSMVVPVVHRGFAWVAADFARLADPRSAKSNPYQHQCHRREGLGATQVVARPNPGAAPGDRFFPETSFFPATAVLRPDPGVWFGTPGPGTGHDVLELHDPLRVASVDLAGRPVSLAADLDAPIAMAEGSVGSRRYTWAGFLNPSVELSMARLGLVEPYRPGKVVVVFAHGLLDNPFIFTDAVNGLRSRPGFLDRFQVVVFRYPTGNSFLRSAAILRRQLRDLAATFDPEGRDPGMRNMVLVGYSMGGLLSKLQITHSGSELWALASSRPVEALVAPESTKAFLRDIFFFEPQPFVTRVVFIATPHDGSELATRVLGRLGSRVVQRPADTKAMSAQLIADNPGVVRPEMEDLPSSVDMLARGGPVLTAMQRMSINPAVTYHTIAGTSHLPLPPGCARGDHVVPLASAHIEGAESELWVPAVHTDIYRAPETIDELDRILRLHAAGVGIGPSAAGPDDALQKFQTLPGPGRERGLILLGLRVTSGR